MDQKVFFLINQEWTAPWLDLPMVLFSSLDFWLPFLVILVLWLLWKGGVKARMLVVTLAIAIALADGVVGKFLKQSVNRPRPRQIEAVRTVDFEKAKPRFLALGKPLKVRTSKPEKPPIEGRSFPSNHTANAFAVATVIFFFSRRWGLFAGGIAVGIAYSRIYTGSHWPTDVLASIPIGIVIGVIARALVNFGWRRWIPRWSPTLAARYPDLSSLSRL